MPKKLLYAELVEITRRAHEADEAGEAHADVWPLLNHILAIENDMDILQIRHDALSRAIDAMTRGHAPATGGDANG